MNYKSELSFQYSVGDAILLSDGRRAIITNYGLYSDQYWCEVSGDNGINLSAADYFSITSTPYISKRLPAEQARLLAEQLRITTIKFDREFGCNTVSYRYGPISSIYSDLAEKTK